jgi:hypothetical protein
VWEIDKYFWVEVLEHWSCHLLDGVSFSWVWWVTPVTQDTLEIEEEVYKFKVSPGKCNDETLSQKQQ